MKFSDVSTNLILFFIVLSVMFFSLFRKDESFTNVFIFAIAVSTCIFLVADIVFVFVKYQRLCSFYEVNTLRMCKEISQVLEYELNSEYQTEIEKVQEFLAKFFDDNICELFWKQKLSDEHKVAINQKLSECDKSTAKVIRTLLDYDDDKEVFEENDDISDIVAIIMKKEKKCIAVCNSIKGLGVVVFVDICIFQMTPISIVEDISTEIAFLFVFLLKILETLVYRIVVKDAYENYHSMLHEYISACYIKK